MFSTNEDLSGKKSFIGSWFLIDTTAFNREAVTLQSPGLFQPWEYLHFQPGMSCVMDATALRLVR